MDREIESAFASIVTGQPHEFMIGGKRLCLWPVTLAKTLLCRRWIDALEMDAGILKSNPYVECLRLAETKSEEVAQLLAIHLAENTYKALHDSVGMSKRCNLLRRVKREHLAALLMTVLTDDRTEAVMEYFGMKAERMRMESVTKVKQESSNSITFGGLTIIGSFIVQLKELGFSTDEILYERSYSFLRLVLADKVTSVYLSDEELERLPQGSGGRLLDGENDGDLDRLACMIKQGGSH